MPPHRVHITTITTSQPAAHQPRWRHRAAVALAATSLLLLLLAYSCHCVLTAHSAKHIVSESGQTIHSLAATTTTTYNHHATVLMGRRGSEDGSGSDASNDDNARPPCPDGHRPDAGFDCNGDPLNGRDPGSNDIDDIVVIALALLGAVALLTAIVVLVIYCGCVKRNKEKEVMVMTPNGPQLVRVSTRQLSNSNNLFAHNNQNQQPQSQNSSPSTATSFIGAPTGVDTWVAVADAERAGTGYNALASDSTGTSKAASPLHSRHSQQQAQRVARDAFADSGITELTLEQVQTITSNFSRNIGRGSFGDVFAGHLCGVEVAVKRFRSAAAGQLPKDWFVEARTLSRLQHPHLLRLSALCTNPDAPCLV